MRLFINLIESTHSTLDRITAETIIHALETRNDSDFHNSWLVRALEAQNGTVQEGFIRDIEERLELVKKLLAPITQSNPVTLWRGTSRPPENGMGIHWSDNRAVAEMHGPYLAEALVSHQSIDWIATVIRRMSWPREYEVSLTPGSHIIVQSITSGKEIIAPRYEEIIALNGKT